MGDVRRVAPQNAPQSGPEGETPNHVLIFPTPTVEMRVVSLDFQKMPAPDHEQAGSVSSAVFGIFLMIDNLQDSTIGNADLQFVAEADHIVSATGIVFGLSHSGQSPERVRIFQY